MCKENMQLSFFDIPSSNTCSFVDEQNKYSKLVYDNYDEVNLGFAFSNVFKIYNEIIVCVPTEKINFTEISLNEALACELICAAICNNINWDYLRSAVYNKVINDRNWITISHLQNIGQSEIEEMFCSYEHPEKIDANSRAKLIRDLADSYKSEGFDKIFFYPDGTAKKYNDIRFELLKCNVFNSDAIEKKLQLLVMKVSKYDGFNELAYKCNPTIDYHIIRSFIRRGFLILKNNDSLDFVNSDQMHQEKTIAAIRKHCANIIYKLSVYLKIDIATINSVEWWIGRSICTANEPDCFLSGKSSNWIKKSFGRCPFFDICLANNEYTQLIMWGDTKDKKSLKNVDSPKYKGLSF